jgi:riboflavin kinase
MEAHSQLTKTCLKGTVIQGRQIGRKIGFPTANLAINSGNGQYLQRGVFGVKIHHYDTAYYGVMNIGVRPTFKDGDPSVSYEVHILNFNQDIYGDQLQVDILFFIREEKAFNSKEQLIQQLNQDIQQVDKRLLQLSS